MRGNFISYFQTALSILKNRPGISISPPALISITLAIIAIQIFPRTYESSVRSYAPSEELQRTTVTVTNCSISTATQFPPFLLLNFPFLSTTVVYQRTSDFALKTHLYTFNTLQCTRSSFSRLAWKLLMNSEYRCFNLLVSSS